MIQKLLDIKILLLSIIIILLLFSLNKCTDTERLKGELEQIKLKKEKMDKEFIKEKEKHSLLVDSLVSESAKERENIKKLRALNIKNEKEIANLKRKADDDKQKISELNIEQLSDWFIIRYGDANNIEPIENGISFKSYIPKVIANELIDKDFLKETNKIHINTIINKDSEIKSMNTIISNKDKENESNKKLLQDCEESRKVDNDVIDNLEKQNKKNGFNKVLKPLIAVGSFILGLVVSN